MTDQDRYDIVAQAKTMEGLIVAINKISIDGRIITHVSTIDAKTIIRLIKGETTLWNLKRFPKHFGIRHSFERIFKATRFKRISKKLLIRYQELEEDIIKAIIEKINDASNEYISEYTGEKALKINVDDFVEVIQQDDSIRLIDSKGSQYNHFELLFDDLINIIEQ